MTKSIGKALISLSIGVFAFSANAEAQTYCSPTFNYPCGYWGGHMHIKSFSTTGGVSNITNNNTGCGSGSGYTYYSSKQHSSVQGTKVNYTIGNCPYYTQHMVMWVDFNRDGDFADAGEEVYNGQVKSGGTQTGSFTIPITATPGNSRLRIRCIPTWYSAPPACGSQYYGEAEDYLFVIIPSCSTKFDKPIDPYSFACANGPGSITVNPGNGDKYQWQVLNGSSFVNITNGGIYSDVDKRTLQLNNVPASMAGTKYRCMITPTCGVSGQTPSDTVALNIRPDVKIVSQTLTDTSCIGLSTILSYTASDAITASQWEIFDQSSGSFVKINGPQYTMLDDSLIITNIPDTLNGAKIRATFTGICGAGVTKEMLLSVNPLPSVVADPRDTLVKQGVNTTFVVEAVGASVNYQWQVGTNSKFVNVNNNGVYSGVKTNKLTISGVSRAQDQFQIRALISGSGSCASAPDTSEFAILSVEPPLSVKDALSENSITVFPNPAKGNEVVLKIDNNIIQHVASYNLTDRLGKVISSGNLSTSGNNAINISKLPSDVYLIQILDTESATLKSLKFTKL